MKPINNEESNKSCICPGCPLFNDCSREKQERAFCAKTKSSCIKDVNGICICGGCPIYSENNLSGGYFCIKEL